MTSCFRRSAAELRQVSSYDVSETVAGHDVADVGSVVGPQLAIMPDLGFERPDGPNTIVVARILRWLSGAAQTENALSDAIGDGL